MIIKKLSDLYGTDGQIVTKDWTSTRLLTRKDNMGFSLHETYIEADCEIQMEYKNHLEAVLCIEGEGEIECIASGTITPITAGTMYALDKHDKHILRGKKRMRMICVFNPPLRGDETHDESGSYPSSDDI